MMIPSQFFINEVKCAQRNRFTHDEDERLKQLVSLSDPPNWTEIARCMNNRSARQCRERYNNYLRSDLVNGPWTTEEEDLLIDLYQTYGPKWSLISQSFSERSAVNVKNHHSSLVSQKSIKERSYRIQSTSSEDQTEMSSKVNSPDSDATCGSPEKEVPLKDSLFDNMFASMNFDEDSLWDDFRPNSMDYIHRY